MPRKKKDLTDSCDSKTEELSPENLNQQPLTPAEILNQRWGRHKFSDSWEDLKEAVVEFAEISRDEYLSSPMAFPIAMRKALLGLAQTDYNDLPEDRISLRGYILKRLGHYLKNQYEHVFDSDLYAAELWSKARQVISQAKFASAANSYAEIRFDEVSAHSLFDIADAASNKEQMDEHLLSKSPVKGRPTKSDAEQDLERLLKTRHFKHEYIKAFWATRTQAEITIAKPARSVGITECDQAKGILRYKSRPLLRFSPTAYGIWLVLRILVESPKKNVPLFDKWYGAFAGHKYNEIIESLGKPGRKSADSKQEHLCRLI